MLTTLNIIRQFCKEILQNVTISSEVSYSKPLYIHSWDIPTSLGVGVFLILPKRGGGGLDFSHKNRGDGKIGKWGGGILKKLFI